jgi:predicted transcriptional regulator
VKTIRELASVDHVAGTKYPEHFKKIRRGKDYLSERIFKLKEMGLKFIHELEDVMAACKEVNNNMQMKAKQLEITSELLKVPSFFTKPSVLLSAVHSMSSDHHDNV